MKPKYWVVDDVRADLPRVVYGNKTLITHMFGEPIAGPFKEVGQAKKAKIDFENRCVGYMDALVNELERLSLGIDPWGGVE